MGNEDLECTDDLSKRDGLVSLPVVCSLNIINEDNEVVCLALEVDLGLFSSLCHFCDCEGLLGVV